MYVYQTMHCGFVYYHDIAVHLHLYTHVDVTESECPPENDAIWNIYWTLATRGDVVQQKCPGGAESLGMKYCCYIYKHSQGKIQCFILRTCNKTMCW